MEIQIKTVSKAALGQLRAPGEADIERRSAAAARSPAQQKAHAQRMAQLDKFAMQFVAMKQQGRQPPAQQQPPRSATRPEPVKAAPRHQTVTTASYGDKAGQGNRGRARTPEHVAIQRSIQAHIRRNVQREARNARFRAVGQQIRARAAGMVQQAGRTARNITQSIAPPQRNRAASERSATPKMQSMLKHREKTLDKAQGKVKVKEIAPGLSPTPARQPQKHQGKEQDRGRTR